MRAVRPTFFVLFGLVIGSFLTVVVSRIPAGEGLGGRSRCPRCGAQIGAFDNIPVLSWILLRGRCRTCGNRISVRYPLIELTTAALFLLADRTFEDLALAIPAAMFLATMLAIALIDAKHKIVPNRIVYPALLILGPAVVVADLTGGPIDAPSAFIGLAAYAGPLLIVAFAVPGGMGMGDVKLAALIGLALGGLGLAYVAVAAGLGIVGGGVGAVLAVTVFKFGRKQQMPFGPYLAAGAVVALALAPQISDLYLSLVGLGR
jgi:leader peptidase (prepilin peptidase)/N-methyltransferase